MVTSEFEIFKVEKIASAFCAERNKHFPPDELRIDYRVEGQNLFVFEVRPRWDNPNVTIEIMVAKLNYKKSKQIWKLYCQRQNMQWVLYEPFDSSKDLQVLFAEINKDRHGCCWG